MSKKFFLEELMEELRTLGEQYEMDENGTDVFLLKANEVVAFAEDVQKIVKDYVEKELIVEAEDDDELEDEEFEDIFWLDDGEELE